MKDQRGKITIFFKVNFPPENDAAAEVSELKPTLVS